MIKIRVEISDSENSEVHETTTTDTDVESLVLELADMFKSLHTWDSKVLGAEVLLKLLEGVEGGYEKDLYDAINKYLDSPES